ncbi:hypothetical protein BJY01DRAFT_227656 [Aspergillus pseudoustus]|uniref:WD40-repeat-containing domain protein n=1 Tax=Aspergillus pseudoustus TaxID=1810923 RepID=A0ABR4IQL3_9EURO
MASGSYDKTIKLWDTKTGSQIRTREGHSNLLTSVASTDETNFQIAVDDNWVIFAGERLLWLPSYYRQFTCSSTLNGTLALGYSDGRVLIMGFQPPSSSHSIL